MTAVLAVAATVVVLDQIVKAIVLDRLALGVPVPIIDGFLSFTLVMNPGLAFGLLGGLPTAWRWLVALLSIVALLILARVAVRVLAEGGRVDTVPIGRGFGGAVGDPIDRARFRAVVGLVHVYFRG